jgi:Fe2+ or Zn2+ uptake regulation protein
MPTAAAERRRRSGRGRGECRKDVVELVRVEGRPLTRKEIVRGLRSAGKNHGPSTVAKALADLTAAGELVNPRDKRGYRLPEWWRKRATPSLF